MFAQSSFSKKFSWFVIHFLLQHKETVKIAFVQVILDNPILFIFRFRMELGLLRANLARACQQFEPVFISDEAAQRHLQCGSLLPQLKLKFQTPLRDGEQHSSSQRCVRQSSATEVFPTHEA